MVDANNVESSLKDEHFHSKDKGCELKEMARYKSHSKKVITRSHYFRCLTHKVDVCRCGWEFGWHYGTNSTAMNCEVDKITGKKKYQPKLSDEEVKEMKRLYDSGLTIVEVASIVGHSQSCVHRKIRGF